MTEADAYFEAKPFCSFEQGHLALLEYNSKSEYGPSKFIRKIDYKTFSNFSCMFLNPNNFFF